ncbi:MAG: shikimate kinase [Deltaproteobacteria bacterium]|nr:shikimate kinase [Deltaproteobacteria bacterium]
MLIGFMGCGKSTVGAALAARLGRRFVDLDAAVEKGAGCSIPLIFERKGEAEFRRLEARALRRALGGRAVVSAGGGLVKLATNRAALKKAHARVVWLDVAWVALWRRLVAMDPRGRPLLWDAQKGRRKSQRAIRALWRERRAAYLAAATVRIVVRSDEASRRTLARVLEELEAERRS